MAITIAAGNNLRTIEHERTRPSQQESAQCELDLEQRGHQRRRVLHVAPRGILMAHLKGV